MSQTIDSPLKLISDSLSGRDKLLKLAEVNSTNTKSGKRKSSSKLSHSASKSVDKEASYDLAFTTNIEHLANRDFSQRSSTPIQKITSEQNNDQLNTSPNHDVNLSCDSNACQCEAHSSSLNDSHLGSISPTELKFSEMKIGEANSFTANNVDFKSRIPQSVDRKRLLKETSGHNQNRGLNRWPDTDDLSMQAALKYHSDRSSHYQASSRSPAAETATTKTAIPQSQTSQTISSSHYVEQSEQHQKMVKSRSHNALQGRGTCGEFPATQLPRFFMHNPTDYFGADFGDSEPNGVPTEDAGSARSATGHLKAKPNIGRPSQVNAKRVINRLDSFFVMDEDSFANSPKRIVNQQQNEEKLDKDHQVNKPTKSSLLISTPDQKQYEKYFLRESQKNALSTINSTTTSVTTTDQTDKFVKSNSCDSLDYFRFQTLMKPKSETDLSEAKNDLAGIMHLEEEIHEEESMFNRFRKTFSLRFSKPWSGSKVDTPTGNHSSSSNNNNSTNSTTVTTTKPDASELTIAEEESQLNQCASDINQNRIYRNKHSESDFQIAKMSTIDRRKSRADMFNRKSFRRNSRKSLRLKRSHSQPNDKSGDQLSPSTDRSIDSDFEGNKGQNWQADTTKSSSELNDSQENNGEVIVFAEAIWDYFSNDVEELNLNAGDLIHVTDTSHAEWWWGAIKGKEESRYGWFPANFARVKACQEETLEEALSNEANEDPELTPKKRMSMSKISSEQVRANVVLELINTEREFVKNLKDTIEGYLRPCVQRVDMFDETRISTIFGNIEELYAFQVAFLAELEQSINWENLSSSQIGHCFLNHEKGFSVYGEFCKNHPLAINELQDLYTDHKYIVFFEGCRLLQNMIDISLDGFLLTPVQRICKYPLQLGELLKYTRPDHPDFEPVTSAHQCMQRVAQMVNERKRRFEALEQLITLQESFENWEGPPLLDCCSLLIHSGEVTRITSSSWSKDVTLMLFDRLLILCKRDTGILKKGTYIFKSRIELVDDVDSVIGLEDGVKDSDFNVITKNAFKFFYKRKQKWYMFQAKSAKEKEKWMRSFEEQRQRVKDDLEQGLVVTERDKKGALIAHQNNLKPKKPRARRPYTKAKKPDTVIAEIPLGQFEIDRNRAGSLPSYIYQQTQPNSLNLYKHRQSTMHNKSKSRSNWFQLGSSNKKKSRLKRNLK